MPKTDSLSDTYKAIMSEETLKKIIAYKKSLFTAEKVCGKYLSEQLKKQLNKSSISPDDIKQMSIADFINALMNTKKIRIYAETDVFVDGKKDWNKEEISILGDINVSVPVKIFDNGIHHVNDKDFQIYDEPLQGTLLFTPGALLDNPYTTTPDMDEVIKNGKIDDYAFYKLYERRLLPLFIHINNESENGAFVTIPGIGCSAFAGKFRGPEIVSVFENTLRKIISTHQEKLPNIKGIYFDPYDQSTAKQEKIGQIEFIVNPYTKTKTPHPQLCAPEIYGTQFKNCKFWDLVAWDHVSWPGNDFNGGMRQTDDGVKGAATNTLEVITEIKGGIHRKYEQKGKLSMGFCPPNESTWEKEINEHNKLARKDPTKAEEITLNVADKLFCSIGSQLVPLSQIILGFKNKSEYLKPQSTTGEQTWGASQVLGRNIILMMVDDPVGFSVSEAWAKKNIANISFSENGALQINLPLPEGKDSADVKKFCKNFMKALEKEGYNSAQFQEIDKKSSYGHYVGQITLSDPTEITNFILGPAGCNPKDLIDMTQGQHVNIDINLVKKYQAIQDVIFDKKWDGSFYLFYFRANPPTGIAEMRKIYEDNLKNNNQNISHSKGGTIKMMSNTLMEIDHLINKIQGNKIPNAKETEKSIKAYSEISEIIDASPENLTRIFKK